MKIVKKIARKGYPVFTASGNVSQRYKKAHASANRATLDKFGGKIAKAVNKIKVPNDELLGSHTKQGVIKVSSRVPKKLRPAIAYHEKIEHGLMT